MLQLNVGLYCNQACSHCHVDSSPLRTETMDRSAMHGFASTLLVLQHSCLQLRAACCRLHATLHRLKQCKRLHAGRLRSDVCSLQRLRAKTASEPWTSLAGHLS